MISIDRSSPRSVHEQLLEQLRYHLVSGQHKVGEVMPSTRRLGDQLGISFHTVRKTYQELEREGLLEPKAGVGYVVVERQPLSKGERMERGAAVVQDGLQRLMGLGLADDEIDYLFQEQMALLEGAGSRYKLIFTAPHAEMAEQCAEQIRRNLQQPVEHVAIEGLDRHRDADYVFAPHPYLRQVMAMLPRGDVIGVVTYLIPDALEKIARLLDEQTLGIVTRYPDAIQPLMREIRSQTGYGGQMIAASVEERTQQLARVVHQTDLVVYTAGSRRRLRSVLADTHPQALIGHVVSRDSVELIRKTVPA